MVERDIPTEGERRATFTPFVQRVLFIFLIAGLALLAWSLARILLVIFAGVLLSVLLRNLATRLSRVLPIGPQAALPLVLVLIIIALGLVGTLFGAQIVEQFRNLVRNLPEALSQIEEQIQDSPFLSFIVEQIQEVDPTALVGQGVIGPVADIAFGAVEGLVSLLVILLVGIYLSMSPNWHREGVISLFPVSQRNRAREVFIECDRLLWGWLIGQFVAMLFVGLLTTVGLLLIGAPMALALGMLAGILNFVPVIGPVVASIPAILVSFSEGPTLALYVLILYIVIQLLESYLIVPLAQRWAVALPPVLTILAVISAGILFGLPGVILATPLMVLIMGLVRMVYVEDMLESQRYAPVSTTVTEAYPVERRDEAEGEIPRPPRQKTAGP